MTVVHVADVVRAVLAAAAGAGTGRVLHLGEPSPRRITELVAAIAAAGGLRARLLPLPAWVLKVAGRAGDVLQGLPDSAGSR